MYLARAALTPEDFEDLSIKPNQMIRGIYMSDEHTDYLASYYGIHHFRGEFRPIYILWA